MASQELGGLKTHGLSVYFWSWRMIPKTPKKPEHCWWVTPKCSPETCFFWISKKKRQRFHLAMAMVFFSLAKPQTKPLRFNQTAAKPSSRAWATCYLRALSRIGHGVEPPRANREIHILQGVLETPRWGVRWAPSAPHLLTLKKPMTDPNDNLWLRLAWCDSTTHLISYPQLQADRAPDYPYQIGSPLHCKQNPKLVKEIYCPSELDAFLFDHKSWSFDWTSKT